MTSAGAKTPGRGSNKPRTNRSGAIYFLFGALLFALLAYAQFQLATEFLSTNVSSSVQQFGLLA